MDQSVTNREQKLYENLQPVVEPLEVELVDVVVKTHEDRPIIRLVVDTESGVGLDRCEEISDYVGPLIELEIPDFDEPYDLEISSPGLERTLRREDECERFEGREVVVNCYAPYEDRKEWRGKLKGRGEQGVLVETEEEELEIPFEVIGSIRLYFDAEEALKSGRND